MANWTNIQIYTLQGSCVPQEKWSLTGSLNYLRASKNPLAGSSIFGTGQDRGWLYIAKTVYKFTPHLTGHIIAEILDPGNYYSPENRNTGYFSRWELMYKF